MTVKEHVVDGVALESSSEVQELLTQFYRAVSGGDVKALDRLVSRRDGIAWIGTDPNEWWQDPGAVLTALRSLTAEIAGPVSITTGGARAYTRGDVAWVSDRPAFHLKDGRTLPFRFTAVWLREPEGWRIVQAHSSFGVANDTVIRAA